MLIMDKLHRHNQTLSYRIKIIKSQKYLFYSNKTDSQVTLYKIQFINELGVLKAVLYFSWSRMREGFILGSKSASILETEARLYVKKHEWIIAGKNKSRPLLCLAWYIPESLLTAMHFMYRD